MRKQGGKRGWGVGGGLGQGSKVENLIIEREDARTKRNVRTNEEE